MPDFPRIAIVSPVSPPYRGGMGTVAAQDAHMLRQCEYTAEVFTPAYEKYSGPITPGVTRLQPFFHWGNGAILPSLFLVLRRFDCIHLHYPFFGSDVFVAFAAHWWKIPLVVTCHMRPKASGILGTIFSMYRWLFESFIFSTARSVLVSSRDYAKAENISHQNLFEYPLAVDVHRFIPGDVSRARSRFGLTESSFTIIFVGGLDDAHYFKGIDILLSACAELSFPWQLMIVGEGNRRSSYETQAKEFAIDDRVHFLGALSADDLPYTYHAADVHVLPSIDSSEAFGIVTLEAMASGVPSIVSDLPGVRSVIIPEETGLLIEPASISSLVTALSRLATDPVLCKTLGTAALHRAQMFSEESSAKRLMDIYTKVLSPK